MLTFQYTILYITSKDRDYCSLFTMTVATKNTTIIFYIDLVSLLMQIYIFALQLILNVVLNLVKSCSIHLLELL